MKDVKEISTYKHHTLFVKTDNTLWGSGNNHEHQLSDIMGNRGNDRIIPPQYILGSVKEARAGEYYSIILKKDNSMWAIGRNDKGQLGTDEVLGYTNISVKI